MKSQSRYDYANKEHIKKLMLSKKFRQYFFPLSHVERADLPETEMISAENLDIIGADVEAILRETIDKQIRRE